MSQKTMIIASKRLNKYLSLVNNGLFQLEILRCRTVYGDVDTACSSLHSHSYFELHLCLSDENSFEINNEVITLKKGEFFLISPKTDHIVYPYGKKYSEFVIAFEFVGDCEIRNTLKSCVYKHKASHFMMQSVNEMINYVLEEKYGCKEFLESILSCFFIDMFAITVNKLDKTFGGKLTDDRIKLVKTYIEDNIDKKILVDDIANHINVSVRHLNRIVKEAESMNATELIRSIRIKHAKHLLMTTKKTLSEIAEATGFCDSYHLGRIFKSVEGITPGEHRKDIHK